MRYCIAIPTFWTHPSGTGPGEIIYDHPTPLHTRGTLRRTLDSLSPLVSDAVQVVVVAAVTAPQLEAPVAAQLQELIQSPPLPYPVVMFGGSQLRALQDILHTRGQGHLAGLLSLSGYSQVRNLTLVLANIWAAEVLVSLDDDEIIADPHFLDKIAEDFAVLSQAHPIFGLAGIYQNRDGRVLVPEPTAPWTVYWPKIRWMNMAFKDLMLSGPRLKPTPLALGGNLALSARLFRQLPFDPALTRGEDIDYVLNARLFKIPFFLDNTLAVIHLPPEKPHPDWLRLRQDLARFLYTRRKLREPAPQPGLASITAAELKPYPGNFLEDDLEDRAGHSHTLLALEYLAKGQPQAALDTLENLALIQAASQPSSSVLATYVEMVSDWQKLQSWLARPEVAVRARHAVEGQP
ncbi:MAG: hypothetical protein PHW74_03495 [Desulfobacca sp.]|nr:hypothetical protein [Desulfobacca sp.]